MSHIPEILAADREVPDSTIEVTLVPERETAQPEEIASFERRSANLESLIRDEFSAEGLAPSDDFVGRLVGGRMARRGRSRFLEHGSTVCHPARVNFFGDREMATILADGLKAIRDDGGRAGAAKRYQQLIDNSDNPGEAVAAKVRERIKQIRWAMAAALNEQVRREAIESGNDPEAATYFKVTSND
ncbi:MAG: hypothetical protein B6A08_14060 [Sorangiineae bacterium NIC37A_2]|nr:MAG: hypothetical protein B6A08_14060 [Sorangiineae bacterium NIC37A_2]